MMRTKLVIAGGIIGVIGFFVPAPYPPYFLVPGLLLLIVGIFIGNK